MEIINETNESQKSGREYSKESRSENKVHVRTGQGRAAGGLILMVVGVVLLLNNFHIIEGSVGYYLFNWRTFLVALGILFITARDNKISGYVLSGLGVLFWLPELLGDYHVSLGDVFWPSILIVIGFVLITRQRNARMLDGYGTHATTGYLNDTSIFGGGVKMIKSSAFKGGNITAIFGGSEFNMSEVVLHPNGAVIDVVTIFGGTKFIVPPDWNVISDAVAILGGISDKRPRKMSPDTKNDEKTLVIKGVVVFGGVEIKSF